MKAGLKRTAAALALAALVLATAPTAGAQRRASDRRDARRAAVRSVTIPVTLRLREPKPQTEVQSIEYLTVLEDGEDQEILSLRGGVRSPLSLAILIQDDLSSSISTEIREIAAFIRRLPPGTRVFVGYLRGGSLQVRQRFTNDLERAARSLRIPVSSSAVAPFNPFAQTIEALRRFESQPQGRRAVILFSDGVDTSRGFDSSTPSQSVDLQRAINEAQRRSVAVFAVYAPTVGVTGNGRSILAGNGQGSLQRLAAETGGRAYFQGFSAPVSINPFLREISTLLPRLFALTYLSTHPDRGFHNIKIIADVRDGEVLYPAGYTR
ncbi:MAG TPA: hypothetical protein VEQ42_10175 [Pyrinomonadaceae bacterium]|nr:hypothetical protein [Pyrinomonadaceae bacterium]